MVMQKKPLATEGQKTNPLRSKTGMAAMLPMLALGLQAPLAASASRVSSSTRRLGKTKYYTQESTRSESSFEKLQSGFSVFEMPDSAPHHKVPEHSSQSLSTLELHTDTTNTSDEEKNLQQWLDKLRKDKRKLDQSLLLDVQVSGDTDAWGKTTQSLAGVKLTATCNNYTCSDTTAQSTCTYDSDCVGNPIGGNNAPTNISLNATSINQSATGAAATVGTLSTTDADGGDSHTYSLVNNGASVYGSCGVSGDANILSFQISGSQLQTASSLSAGSYNVCVQTHDGTTSYQKTFSITVSDNVAPSFQNSTPSLSGTTVSQTTLAVRLDEIGTAYYVVVSDGDGTPSAAQVKAGQNSSGGAALDSGSISVTSAGADYTDTITGLSSATAYDIYVVAEDDEGTPNLQSSATLVNLTTNSPDSDGNLTASATVTEPIALYTTVDTVGEAVDVFDFTLSDGGTADGLAMTVSQIVINVSGTASDAIRDQVTWRLNGNDASNVTGTYNSGSDTITFSGLSISIADGASETYTVNAYYNDNTSLTEDQTFILSVDGDTDLTVGGSGTSMGATSAVTNGTGSTVDVTATALAFTTQPSGSTSGSALSTQPVVTAQDAFGNTDVDFTETITVTEASSGSLSNNTTSASSGVATFSNLTYTASADQESFTLTANDQNVVDTDLPTVDANSVTSDVVATKLTFSTEPAPTTVTSTVNTSFTTVPVVKAVDANNTVDTGYATDISLAEVNGAGSATMTATGDTDGSGSTVTITPSSGVSTFTSMAITYTASGGSDETFNLQASSGALTTANSTQLTGHINVAPTDIALDSTSVNQSDGTNGVVGNLSSTDSDSSSFTYSLVAGTGDTDNASFNINSAELRADDASSLSAGSYSVRLQTDDGLATYEEAFTITVVDDVAPSVSSVSLPSNGTYVAGDTLDFTVNYDENITVNTGGGTPYLALTIGSTSESASYISGSGTTALVFRYTVQSGDEDTDGIALSTTLQTNGGTLQDSAANDAGTSLGALGSLASVLVDAVAPDAPASLDLATASDTGSSSTDDITTDTTPTITGTAEANSTVNVSSDQDGSLGSTTADGSGNWSYTPGTALSENTHSITATATDAANNTGSSSTALSITIDTTAPTITISSDASDPTNGSFTATFTFSESVSGFAVGDISAGNASLSNFSGSGTTYTATVTPTSDGTATLDVAANSAQDSAGNNNTAATQYSVDYDATAPTVTITSDASDPTNSSFTATFTFSESVSGFAVGDISAGNASLSNFSGSGTTYTATVTPTSDGAITLDVAANGAQDSAGNNNTAATQYSLDYDASAPTVTITSDASDPTNSSFTATFTFSESVSGFAVGDISAGNASLSNFSGSGTTYTATVTPTSDGAITLDVAANSAQDSAGNNNIAATQYSVDYDATAPTVTITSDASDPTNSSFTATFTFSESVSGFAVGDISAGNASLSNFSGSGTTYTATVTPTSDGTVTLDVAANGAQDSAGNNNTAATQYSLDYDGSAPTVTITSDASDPTNSSFTATFTFSESVSGFAVGDISAGNASLSNFSGSGTTYTATVTPTSDGTVTLDVAANGAQDSAGNNNTAATQYSVDYDGTAPTVTITSDASDPTNSSFTATFTFSESVSGFAVGDISASNASLSNFSGSGTTYTATVSPTSDGTVTLDVSANTAQDSVGNNNTAATQYSVEYDATSPSVSSLSPTNGATDALYNDNLVLTFGESVQALSGGSNTVDVYRVNSGGDVLHESIAMDDASVSISGAQVTIDLTSDLTPTEIYYVQIGNAAIEDGAGNLYSGIADTTSWRFTVDNAVPQANNDSATTNEDSAVAVDVLANDTDTDSSLNAASVTITSDAANGSTSINTATGVITYTPDGDYNGSDSFAYTVEDVYGGVSSAAAVSVTINAVNDTPDATNDIASTSEDTAVLIDVMANDSDIDSGDSLDGNSLQLVSAPSNGTAVVNAGQFEYTPDSNFNGSDSFTYTVDDSNGATSNTATVIVNVSSVNDVPTVANDNTTTDEDTAVVIDVLANDSDLDGSIDVTTVTIMSNPSNGSTQVDGVTGEITYTPNADYNGSDSFTYVVEDDSNGTSAPATVSITINAVNDAPVAVNDTAVLLEDTAHTINAKGNDSDVDDVNGDLTLSVVTDPAQGSVSINSGAFVYTPNADFNGSDSFTYQLTDPSSATSNTATVTLTIQSVNDDPIANNDTVQTDEDTPVDIAVLDNDSDVDGTLDTSSVAITTSPSQGQVSVDSFGVVTYTPTENYYGSDSFAYTVTDDQGGVSASATVSITINSVNDDPIAVDDSASTDEDNSVDIAVLDNDSDIDGTIASLAIDTDPGNGSVLVNGDNTVTYTPDADFNGEDSFTYTVTDDLGGVSTAATVTVTVNPVNDAPVISGTPSATAAEDSAYSFTAIGADVDTGDNLTYSITNKPSWASFDTATGVLSGTPTNADVGTTTGIVITVTDSSSANASLTSFDLTVINTNDAPVVSGTPVIAAVEGVSYSFNISASDVDVGDMITYVISNNPAWLSINGTTGVVTGTPSASDVGTATGILVGANDGTVTVNLSAFGITVVGDLDGDTVGDDVDTDIDGDGMDNAFEESNGLNPRNASDATSDLDGDGTNNLNEYVAGTNVGIDDYPPEVTAPADITVNATGLFTEVDLGTATAVDARDGTLTPTPNKGSHFAPGVNTVVWTATDAAGNSSSDTQVVNVIPLVDFSKNQTVGEDVGTVTLKVILNGNAVSYPVTVPYTISGSATAVDDHNAVAGVATIESGRSVSISFDVVDDGVNGEPEETIVFEMGTPTNAVVGPHRAHTVEVIEGNVAPLVSIKSTQSGTVTRIVEQSSADVVVTATVIDANVNDTHTYDWSSTDNALTDNDSSDNTFTFTPSSVGLYIIDVQVTDSGTPSGSDSARTTINVIASLPTLGNEDSDGDGVDDLSEGIGDEDSDGIPDYLDHVGASPNTLPEQSKEFNEFLIESEPGLKLSLGQVAFNASRSSASVTDNDITNYGNRHGADADDDFSYPGGRFDFGIDELPVAGQSVNIVIPQFQAIPQNAVYRKLMPSGWRDFVIDDNNSVSSAMGSEGFCPPPGDSSYLSGLTEGHWCVQLTVEDGGPNDADGVADNTVTDPGGVAQLNRVEVEVVGKGGGGSFDFGGLFALTLLMLHRTRRWIFSSLKPLLVILPLLLISASSHAWYTSGSVGKAAGDETLSDLNQQIVNEGINATATASSDNRTAWKLLVGQSIDKTLSFEASYVDLGDINTKINGPTLDVQEFFDSIEKGHPSTARGLNLGARWSYMTNSKIELNGLMGVFIWNAEYDLKSRYGSRSVNESGKCITLGLGAGYNINPQFGLRFDLERYVIDREEIYMWSAGLQYLFD